MAQPTAERSDERTWRLALSWFALALALRLLFLGRFSLWGDEIYSYDDALTWGTSQMRVSGMAYPLFFALERAVLGIAGLAGGGHLDPQRIQWWLRIVPALAGAAAVPAIFVGARAILSLRERHVAAAFVTLSPWLLFYSQYARFYTLLLALSTPAAFGMIRAWRDADLRAGIRASAWLLLAVLAHPTALLLLGGHVAGVLAAAALRLRPLNRGLVGPLAVPLLLAVPACIRPELVVKTLFHRFTVQDAGSASVPSLLLGVGYNVGPAVVALAMCGLPLLWRRDRVLCVHLLGAVGAPFLVVAGMAAAHMSVEQRYLLAIVPLALCPAAIAVAALTERVRAARAGGLLVPVAALVPYVPGVVSNYVDGDRHDMAGATRYVVAHLQGGDGIIADWNGLMRRYLPDDFPDERLLEAPPASNEQDRVQFDRMWSECPRIWVVVPAEFEDQNAETRRFQEWAWRAGRLQTQLWSPRLDYHQNRLRVFLVEPRAAPRWTENESPR